MSILKAMHRPTSLVPLLLALSACAAPATNPTTPAATGATPTAAATGAATISPTTVATAVGATSGPNGKSPLVDLTFTGDRALVAKGSTGACGLGHGADGSVVGFGFTASESDYPGLGDSFNITEDIASHKFSVKWVVAGTFYAGVFAGGVTASSDHHSVTIDADIPAGVGRTEHLKGSISCP